MSACISLFFSVTSGASGTLARPSLGWVPVDFRPRVSYYFSGRSGCPPPIRPSEQYYQSSTTRVCVHNSSMSGLSIDEIRRRFESATAFNVLFDTFEQAIGQRIEDMELYRLLFWNKFLSADEVCLFGQKLAHEFPHHAYEIYLWLASMFAVNYSFHDNYELALEYFERAANAKPDQPTPYLDAAACYEPD